MSTPPDAPPVGPSRVALISAWAFPVFVVGGFALLSGLPVIAAVISAVRSRGARTQRVLTAVMALAYLVPLASWRFSSSEAPSLTKYLSPTATAVVVATGVVVAVALTVLRFRSRGAAGRAAA